MYNFFPLVQTFYCKNRFLIYLCVTNRIAQMAELVDALVSGTSDRKIVQVRVLFWAQKRVTKKSKDLKSSSFYVPYVRALVDMVKNK